MPLLNVVTIVTDFCYICSSYYICCRRVTFVASIKMSNFVKFCYICWRFVTFVVSCYICSFCHICFCHTRVYYKKMNIGIVHRKQAMSCDINKKYILYMTWKIVYTIKMWDNTKLYINSMYMLFKGFDCIFCNIKQQFSVFIILICLFIVSHAPLGRYFERSSNYLRQINKKWKLGSTVL